MKKWKMLLYYRRPGRQVLSHVDSLAVNCQYQFVNPSHSFDLSSQNSLSMLIWNADKPNPPSQEYLHAHPIRET